MHTPDHLLIGVDVGHTNIKCIALDPHGNTLAMVRIPTSGALESSHPATVVLREGLMRALSLMVLRLRETYPQFPPVAVAVSSVGCAGICLDEQGRQVKLDAMVDPAALPDDYQAATSYPPDYANAGARLLTLGKRQPQRLARVAHIASVDGYLTWCLCGAWSAQYSVAGSMSLIDRRTRQWWDIYDKIGLGARQFGALAESGAPLGPVLGPVAQQTGLPEGTLVVNGGHDYLCAAFAAGAGEDGHLFSALGSVEMLARLAADTNPTVGPPPYPYAFCDYHVVPGWSAATCETPCAGILESLRHRVFEPSLGTNDGWDSLFDELNRRDSRAPTGAGAMFFPCRPSPGLPPGIFSHPHVTLPPVDRLATAIDGLCLSSRGLFEGQGAAAVTAVGGGTRNRYWMQTKANVLNRALHVPAIPEASAAGAALLAGVGAKVFSSHAAAAKAMQHYPITVFEPDGAEAQKWDHFYAAQYRPAMEQHCGRSIP